MQTPAQGLKGGPGGILVFMAVGQQFQIEAGCGFWVASYELPVGDYEFQVLYGKFLILNYNFLLLNRLLLLCFYQSF